MDELKKILSVALVGEERERAIRQFNEHLAAWDMTMPPAEILVQDFGLGDFGNQGLIECWIANEVEAGYCGKFLFVLPGQACPMHHHREKHETFYIVHGTVAMTSRGTTRAMGPGEVFPVAPGTPHSFRGIGAALLLEVSKTCFVDDNFFEDPRIPIGGNQRGSAPP
jgi:mannose-6-phosphate isomerase-like protein (cupin superfamily)